MFFYEVQDSMTGEWSYYTNKREAISTAMEIARDGYTTGVDRVETEKPSKKMALACLNQGGMFIGRTMIGTAKAETRFDGDHVVSEARWEDA